MNSNARKKPGPQNGGGALGRYPQGYVREDVGPAPAGAADVQCEKEPGLACFQLEAPTAASVRLAADFSSWEKHALDMIPAEGGIWRITVALPPGRYAYRFLVDGEWRDDPASEQREENNYGEFNSVIEVP